MDTTTDGVNHNGTGVAVKQTSISSQTLQRLRWKVLSTIITGST